MRSDDELASVLVRSLDGDPPAPSRVDIARAITTGRRVRLRRRIAATATAAGVTAATLVAVPAVVEALEPSADAPPAAAPTATGPTTGSTDTGPIAPSPAPTLESVRSPIPPPTQCTISRLPEPDGANETYAAVVDPTGRYILGRSYTTTVVSGTPYEEGVEIDREIAPVMWDNGVLHELGTYDSAYPNDVNSAGVAVGFAGGGDGSTVAWVYRDGSVTELPGGPAEALGINDSGVIAGSVLRDVGAPALYTRPAIWESVTSDPIELPVPRGTLDAVAVDVDADGTVVGIVGVWSYVWLPDGLHYRLELPDGRRLAQIYAIRDGWVVGTTADKDTVRVNVHTGEAQLLTGAQYGSRYYLRPDTGNIHGWLVGPTPEGVGLLATSEGELALPRLPDSTNYYEDAFDVSPVAISDNGRVIAGNHELAGDIAFPNDESDSTHAVVWHCS